MAGAIVHWWRAAEQMVEALRNGDRNLLPIPPADRRTRNLEQAEALLGRWLADPHNPRLAKIFSGR